jgi:glycosyltransferase involved in cell wall biosynthesis
MIVKNEAARIERALESCVQFIEAAAIVDTGSTDNTKQIICDFFRAHQLPCSVVSVEFIDWSQARNAALEEGRRYAAEQGCDYLLLMDADMELKVLDVIQFLGHKVGPSYDMYQHAGATHYQNRRLVHAALPSQYLGVTHEYLDVPSAGCIPESEAFFIDHADGANRPDKFKRDIRLLKEGLKKEPNNVRYFFYLANSYRDAGSPHKAIEWYKRRIEAGGWDEEVWNAQFCLAHCYKTMGNEAEFIRNLLIAYNMRPSRAESLYDLAHFYRDKGQNAPAALFAEAGMTIPHSNDALFVNDFVYEAGLKEEFSISAFYVTGKKAKGFEVTDHLSLLAGPYGGSRELARMNMYFYLPALVEICPSFAWSKIGFTAPENWTAMNPSVTRHHNQLSAIVRCVNYEMDEQGRYHVGNNWNLGDDNPIKTRNFLVDLDGFSGRAYNQREVLPRGNEPLEFKAVLGYEDMRLFYWRGEFWTSSTVRQMHPDGNCEQVLAKIAEDETGATRLINWKRMLRQPRATEKNWMPIVEGDRLRFMWKLGEVVDAEGATIINHPTGLATDHIRGSSQLIPFENGWLSVVHEARNLPDSHLRYYYHRFAFFDHSFKLVRLSRPFVFNDKVIEFCAGMCWHPDDDRLVISYGSRDCEARIATINHKEVSALLWFKSK